MTDEQINRINALRNNRLIIDKSDERHEFDQTLQLDGNASYSESLRKERLLSPIDKVSES